MDWLGLVPEYGVMSISGMARHGSFPVTRWTFPKVGSLVLLTFNHKVFR